MSSSSRDRPPRLPPPPASRRASGTQAIVRKRLRKPRRVEFLDDDLVHADVAEADEFLPDEFVLDAPPDDTAPLFAGVSDAPPPLSAAAVPQPPPGCAPPTSASRPPTLFALRPGGVAFAFAMAVLVGIAVGRQASDLLVPAATRAVAPAALDVPAMSSSASVHAASSSSPNSSAMPVEHEAPVPAAAALASAPPPDTRPEVGLAIKRAAQDALEHGKVGSAIDLGRQAVALDPGDAESWLILGAAYLQRGRYKDARRAFSDCVAQANHGARSECAALLR